MMHVSLPFGAIGIFSNWLTKFLFLDAYKVSHDEYLRRVTRGKRFSSLGNYFEFKIHLESNFISNSTIPMSYLVLNNVSGKTFQRVEVLVVADAGYAKYQDFTTLIDVDGIPLVVNLPRIPLKELDCIFWINVNGDSGGT